jgi:glycosyltransferase involved in cell wall biosynthesis
MKNSKLLIAWLVPDLRLTVVHYWEPLFDEFQRYFPNVMFLAPDGVHPHYKEKFNVKSLGRFKRREHQKDKYGFYARGINILPLLVLLELFKIKPKIIISSEFNLWTVLAGLFKYIGHWKLIVLVDGYSPTYNYENDLIRVSIRKWIAKRTDAFITNSMRCTTYLQDTLKASHERIFQIVYLTPDINALIRKTAINFKVYKGKRPRFLYIGQLIPRKGVGYLLRAWAKFKKLSPDQGSLWIVGEGTEKKTLMKQAKTLDLKDIHFVGEIKRNAVGSWYSACDIFVFPTLEDIWGLVILEAMVFGKPVICSKYANAAELIRHGENGFVFEPKDISEFAELLFKFVNSPVLIHSFGQNSKKIIKPYTISNAVSGFVNVIETILQRKKITSE